MAEYTLPLTAEGAVTAPTGFLTLTVPTVESVTYFDIGPVNVLEIPEFGWAVADGVNPLRLVTRGSVYNCGGLAPATAPTLAVAGAVRATATITAGANPSLDNNDSWLLRDRAPGTLPSAGYGQVTIKTALSAVPAVHEVLLGASDTVTIQNFQKLINGTGIQGTDYMDLGTYLTGTPWWATTDIEISGITTTVITFRAKTYGAIGNGYVLTEVADSGTSSTAATFSGGSAGTGSAPAAGTYRYFYTWYRDADGAETFRSPIATIESSSNNNITVSGLTGSADTTFDFIRVYRTAKQGVEFYIAGTVPRASTSFTDDVTDQALVRGDPFNELLFRRYEEGMPPRGRALALWKGSVWTLGAHLHAEYTRGTVSVTEGNATATFSVKGVTERMVGRTFQVAATSEEYTILSVAEAGPTCVLDRVYEGTTNATASFTIMDDYDAARIRRCVPFLYNQWPVDESPGRVDTDDVEGGTALLATVSRLFCFSKNSIVAVTGEDPESWEISKVAQGVGCVAPRMVVGVEGGGVFLSNDGFYGISPEGALTCISSPKAPPGELARGIDGTVARINWSCIDQGYSEYDVTDRIVIFGVPLDGAVVPNYEIVFDLQNLTWTTYKRAEWTALARITLPGGGPALLSGDRDGDLWHVGIGESDGFYGAEALNTLTGAQTVRVLTASGASFSTSGDGEKGKPVIVLYANGTTVAFGKVASNTGTTLTLAEDLATAPVATDQIILGGIAGHIRSGFPTFGEEYRSKTLRSVTIRHSPTTRGDYHFSFAVDGGSFRVCPVGTSIGSLSESDGKVRHFTQWPGDTHAINLRTFKPGGRATIRGGVFDLIVREQGGAS